MSVSRVRENHMPGLKRRGLETEHEPPRQSPTLLESGRGESLWCSIVEARRGVSSGQSAQGRAWIGLTQGHGGAPLAADEVLAERAMDRGCRCVGRSVCNVAQLARLGMNAPGVRPCAPDAHLSALGVIVFSEAVSRFRCVIYRGSVPGLPPAGGVCRFDGRAPDVRERIVLMGAVQVASVWVGMPLPGCPGPARAGGADGASSYVETLHGNPGTEKACLHLCAVAAARAEGS